MALTGATETGPFGCGARAAVLPTRSPCTVRSAWDTLTETISSETPQSNTCLIRRIRPLIVCCASPFYHLLLKLLEFLRPEVDDPDPMKQIVQCRGKLRLCDEPMLYVSVATDQIHKLASRIVLLPVRLAADHLMIMMYYMSPTGLSANSAPVFFSQDSPECLFAINPATIDNSESNPDCNSCLRSCA